MELKINRIITESLKDFLSKLSNFNKYVFIKINEDEISSHVFVEEDHRAVKLTTIKTTEVFLFDKKFDETIKIAFYDIKNILTALNYFTKDNTKGVIKYDKYDDLYLANSFELKNDKEKFKLSCLDPNFTVSEMTEAQLNLVFNLDGLQEDDSKCFAKFYLDNETIKTMENRLKLSKDDKKFCFKVEDNKIIVVTKNNELIISDDAEILDKTINCIYTFKNYLVFLDREHYNVELFTNKIIFKSTVSDTKICLALANPDENLEDYNEDENIEEDIDNLNDMEFNDEI